jgi:hypothetical protein
LARTESKTIPKNFRADLNEKLDQLWRIVNEIESISIELDAYTAKELYLDEPELQTAYEKLHRVEILYHDFSEIKNWLYIGLTGVYHNQLPPKKDEPFVQISHSLYQLVVYARQILVNMKTGQEKRAVAGISSFAQTLDEIRMHENQDVKVLGNRRGINGNTASVYYERILLSAGAFLANATGWQNGRGMDPGFAEYGIDYYYYNERLINLYNRFGHGLVYNFNLLTAMSPEPLLMTVEEPHWFRMIRPDPEFSLLESGEALNTTDTLTISVQAKPTPPSPPAPLQGAATNNLVLLLDVSGSMSASGRMPLLKNALRDFLELLRPDDRLSIVTYSGKAQLVLPPTSSTEKDSILNAIDHLRTGGKTDLKKGVRLAFTTASNHYLTLGNNRIILASDGVLNIPGSVKRMVKENGKTGISFSVFYFGSQDLMSRTDPLRALSGWGNGNFNHITEENVDAVLLKEAGGR